MIIVNTFILFDIYQYQYLKIILSLGFLLNETR